MNQERQGDLTPISGGGARQPHSQWEEEKAGYYNVLCLGGNLQSKKGGGQQNGRNANNCEAGGKKKGSINNKGGKKGRGRAVANPEGRRGKGEVVNAAILRCRKERGKERENVKREDPREKKGQKARLLVHGFQEGGEDSISQAAECTRKRAVSDKMLGERGEDRSA